MPAVLRRVARRLFGEAERRSCQLALRPEGCPLEGRPVRYVRKPVFSVTRPLGFHRVALSVGESNRQRGLGTRSVVVAVSRATGDVPRQFMRIKTGGSPQGGASWRFGQRRTEMGTLRQRLAYRFADVSPAINRFLEGRSMMFPPQDGPNG